MTNYFDSSGKPIDVGDTVRFRGERYTIASFGPKVSSGYGTAQISFVEDQHTDEVAEEFTVDIVPLAGGATQ